MKKRFSCIVAVHLFLIKNKQVLLLKRNNTGFFDGHYSVIAGHIDGNETASQAMIREAKEEADIIILPKNLHFTQVMHRLSDRERIDFFFTCRQWQGQPNIAEPDKCSQLKWSDLNKLPNNTIPYINYAIQNYLKNNPFTTFGW